MNTINTPYDDVFRTILNDCPSLIIPVVNEAFQEQYDKSAQITLLQNEHYINQQDGEEQKRITDTCFIIEGLRQKKYHIECQSSIDSSMLIRMFEYDSQIALDNSQIEKNVLTVAFPNSAILLLRENQNVVDTMQIQIKLSEGTMCHKIPVLRIQKYGLEEIFKKNLLLLIPFYIFNYEKKFKAIEHDTSEQERIKQTYADIREQLEQQTENGQLDEFVKCTIIDMTKKVAVNLASKYDKVKEGVVSIMGGKILNYEAKDILNRGKELGRSEGKIEGKLEGTLNTLFSLVHKGLLSLLDASEEAGLSEEVFKNKMQSAGYKL